MQLERREEDVGIGGGGRDIWERGEYGKAGAPSQGSRTIRIFLLVALQFGEKGTPVEILLC